MPEILFQFASGMADQLVQTAHGNTVMKAAVDAGIEGIEGECGGVLTCATCHVHIDQDWTDRIEPASFDEIELLEMVDEVTPASRLSCQISVTDALNGIIVKIPAANH